MTVQFYRNSIASANLVNYKVFREIHRECQIFDKTFKLGSTACMCYTIKVTKGGLGNFSSLLAVDDGVRIATLEVDSIDTENEQYDEYVLVDYMVRFNEPYDGSQVVGTSGCTLLQLLQDICLKHNVTLDSGSTQFIGYNKHINWYDSTITAREYIGYIAELNGGMAYITGDGKLAFKQFKSSTASKGTIPVTQLSNWKLGNQVMVTRVVYDTHTGIMWSAGTDTNNTVYVSTNNVYITEEADITNIYNVVNGFTFYSVKTGKCPIVQNAQPGDIITFMDTEANTYNTIVQINQDYMLGWLGSYELQIANEFQEETQVIDSKTMIKTIKTEIDREVGEISSTVASVEESTSTITNMLYDTNAPSLAKVYGPNDRYFSSVNNADYIECTYINLTDAPRPTINYGINVNVIQTIPSGRVRAIAWPNMTLTAGTTYTLSCYARLSTANTGGNIGVYFCYGANPYADAGYGETYYVTSTDWTRFSWTFTADSTYFNADGKALIYVGMFALSGTTAGGIDLCNYFLQPSDYTIENLQNDLSGVNSQITTINTNVSNIQQTTNSIQTQVSQTQTTLKDNYATKEELSSSVSSLSSTIEQTASGINVTISNVQSTVNSQGSQITTLETYIGATSRGLEIGRNTDDVKAVLGNNELAFYDKGNTKLAWLNSDEGLGATGLSIGNATTANQRWRVFTRQNGSHLTFTRHS